MDLKTLSITHDLMKCTCTGSGDIPIDAKDDQTTSEDSRDCQLELKKTNQKQQITINHLLSWQHYKQPIVPDLLKVMYINLNDQFFLLHSKKINFFFLFVHLGINAATCSRTYHVYFQKYNRKIENDNYYKVKIIYKFIF